MNTPKHVTVKEVYPEHHEILRVETEEYNATIVAYKKGVYGLGHANLLLSRHEAIEMAQNILLHFEVPFCNKVEGAGVREA